MFTDPMRTKDEYAAIVEHISAANSPVGSDAQLTHAIITITYLQQISDFHSSSAVSQRGHSRLSRPCNSS